MNLESKSQIKEIVGKQDFLNKNQNCHHPSCLKCICSHAGHYVAIDVKLKAQK